MSVVLTRVDDRLIHGQVVVGWAQALRVKRIVLIDDDVRESAWEQELYALGVPPGLQVEFVSVAESVASLDAWMGDDVRTILLLSNIPTLERLCEQTQAIGAVNIGGVHEREGRSQRLAYVYVSDGEAAVLRRLSEHGIVVTAQDVPTAKASPLSDWL